MHKWLHFMHQIISINIQWISNVERNEEVFDIQTKTHLLWHIYNQYQTIWPLLVPGLECWPPRPGPSPSSPPPSPSWPGWRSRRRSPGAAGPPPVHRTVLYMRDERGYAVIMFNQQCHIINSSSIISMLIVHKDENIAVHYCTPHPHIRSREEYEVCWKLCACWQLTADSLISYLCVILHEAPDEGGLAHAAVPHHVHPARVQHAHH